MLAGLGAVGLASAGSGLGTSAFFSDEETFGDNTLTAGELDLKVSWQQTYTGLNSTKPGTLAAAFEVLDRNDGRIPLDDREPFMGFAAGETDSERDCLPGETTLDVGFA
ncbi:hypothetical protein EO776_17970 (plasmid) [Halorubrum ezzemoulense]|uniref:Uncharacterized protein n=1 Tax=Halorubrum ezzemoulense TaxID=337243 RepID=A0A481RLA3_HALEZ|nr:hypothetical protein EO776_17970 [Halorubrum ezzemoulense]